MEHDYKNLAFKAHLTEYETVRAEILVNFAQQDRLASYALALATGSSTLFVFGDPPFALQQPSVLLIASLLLSAIGWALIETSLTIQMKSHYILNTLAPKVQLLVGPEEVTELRVLRWSEKIVSHTPRAYFHGMMAAGKYATCFLPSATFIIIFLELSTLPFSRWLLGSQILFIASVIVLFLALPAALLKLMAALRKWPIHI